MKNITETNWSTLLNRHLNACGMMDSSNSWNNFRMKDSGVNKSSWMKSVTFVLKSISRWWSTSINYMWAQKHLLNTLALNYLNWRNFKTFAGIFRSQIAMGSERGTFNTVLGPLRLARSTKLTKIVICILTYFSSWNLWLESLNKRRLFPTNKKFRKIKC